MVLILLLLSALVRDSTSIFPTIHRVKKIAQAPSFNELECVSPVPFATMIELLS